MCMGPMLSNLATNCSNSWDNCLLRLMKQYMTSLKYGAALANWLILQKSLCRNSSQINSDFGISVVVAFPHSYFSAYELQKHSAGFCFISHHMLSRVQGLLLPENTINLALIRWTVKAFYKWKSLVPTLIYIVFHTYFFHHMLQFSLYPLSQAQWPPWIQHHSVQMSIRCHRTCMYSEIP